MFFNRPSPQVIDGDTTPPTLVQHAMAVASYHGQANLLGAWSTRGPRKWVPDAFGKGVRVIARCGATMHFTDFQRGGQNVSHASIENTEKIKSCAFYRGRVLCLLTGIRGSDYHTYKVQYDDGEVEVVMGWYIVFENLSNPLDSSPTETPRKAHQHAFRWEDGEWIR